MWENPPYSTPSPACTSTPETGREKPLPVPWGQSPGTGNRSCWLISPYSLRARSAEEIVARDFLCFAEPDAAVVVCDATCLERGLLLVMQVLETCPRTLLCVNLLDEAEKRQIAIDLPQLEQLLGIPVVGMAARSGTGLPEFQQRLFDLLHQPAPQPLPCPVPEQLEQPLEQIQNELPENLCGLQREWTARRLLEPEPELHEKIAAHGNISLEIPALSDALEQTWKQYSPEVCADAMIAAIVRHSEALAAQTVHQPEQTDAADRRLDRILAGYLGGLYVRQGCCFFRKLNGVGIDGLVREGALTYGDQIHGADRAFTRLVLANLGMHGTSPLAGLVLLEVVAMRRVVNFRAGLARL